ncbi:MAG: RecX family transcriptional regulator [Gordonibacter sp.]|uniref:regulatory protein RecX n=1 Tax=Gordonibacter sp. TaxID=1968902 RepID=UPI002FC94A13
MDDTLKARLRAQIAAIEAKNPTLVLSGHITPGSTCKGPCGNEGTCSSKTNRSTTEDEGSCEAPDERGERLRAFRKIERLCNVREQASEQLRRRLVRDGFSEAATEAAIVRALGCGLVDDARFAEVLVRCRLAAGKGMQGIERELSSLGIEPSSVSGWPDEFSTGEESEIERALALLERKPPRAKNQRDAAYRRLAQKGFSASIATTAARLWSESAQVGSCPTDW